MTELLIATSTLPPRAEEEIERGLRYRIDYLELANRMGSDRVDYGTRIPYPTAVEKVEQRFKLDVFWAWKLGQLVRRTGYDVVFSLSERIGIPMSFTIPKKARHLVMLHHPMSAKKLKFLKMTGTAKRWDKVLFFSRAEQRAFGEHLGLQAQKLSTLHFPIDTDFFYPQDGQMKESSEDFIFSIGLSHRDYPTLLRALGMLPDIPCVISGTSAWVDHAAGYEKEPLPDNVEIRNYDHPDLIRRAYAQCRFVVIPIDPNTTQWSAGAASVLQPQAMGRTVVATRMPGLADYVEDGVTGVLVDGGNAQAMATAIRDLWEQPGRSAEMGRAAAQRIVDHFSLEKWLCQAIAIFEGL